MPFAELVFENVNWEGPGFKEEHRRPVRAVLLATMMPSDAFTRVPSGNWYQGHCPPNYGMLGSD